MSERRDIPNMVISDLQKPYTPDVQARLQRSAMQKKGGTTWGTAPSPSVR